MKKPQVIILLEKTFKEAVRLRGVNHKAASYSGESHA
jgi:hypothetical protein